MLKKLSFTLIIFSLILIACSSVKILRQTDDTAIIEASDSTKARAILKAEDKAREMFGDFTETKEPNCSETFYANASTEWVCTIYVQKKK